MKCNVCGDNASGYHNGGALSCPSCRVFFRRMSLRQNIHACVLDGNCDINLTNRSRSCMYCRYQKCLRIGMRPSSTSRQAYFYKEPTTMEATITEDTWTEHALSIVSKVRASQVDVDKITAWVSGLRDSTLEEEPLLLILNLSKSILSGMVNDLDNIQLDHDSSTVAYLWINIGSCGCKNLSEDIKHFYNIFPTHFELYEETIPFTMKEFYKENLTPEQNQNLEKTLKRITYFSSDRNIYSLVLLSLLTGNQEEAKNLNRTVNKMLLKKLHQKYPYEGDEIIRFIQRQLIKVTNLLPYHFELPKSNEEASMTKEMPKEKTFCQFCQNSNPRFKCSRCKLVKYCNPNCQANDWSIHASNCKSKQ